jgi:hypothetical protein
MVFLRKFCRAIVWRLSSSKRFCSSSSNSRWISCERRKRTSSFCLSSRCRRRSSAKRCRSSSNDCDDDAVDDDDRFKLGCEIRILFFFRWIIDGELASIVDWLAWKFVVNVVGYSLDGKGDDGRFRPRRLNRCLLESLVVNNSSNVWLRTTFDNDDEVEDDEEDLFVIIDWLICSKPIVSRRFSFSGIFTTLSGCGFWLRASVNDGYNRRLLFHCGLVLIRNWVKLG